MEEVLKGIFDVIIWTFVPTVMGITLMRSFAIAGKIEQKHYKHVARSGFWAGVILFLFIVVYQIGGFLKAGFPDVPIYQGLSIVLTVVSALATFAAFSGGRRAISPKLAGWIVLVVTSVSSWILFHYLFVHTWNEFILSIVLGVSFGIFGHTAFSPLSLDDLVKFSDE